jgi:hypothetical protein
MNTVHVGYALVSQALIVQQQQLITAIDTLNQTSAEWAQPFWPFLAVGTMPASHAEPAFLGAFDSIKPADGILHLRTPRATPA